MFLSLEPGCLEREQRRSDTDKESSSEGHGQVSDEHEDGTKAHR
jgi:hypothetical protein